MIPSGEEHGRFEVDLEDSVPAQHPLRAIDPLVNEVLAALDGESAKVYAESGRLSIAPDGCCGHCCCRRFILHDTLGTSVDGARLAATWRKEFFEG
jgi:hypothetical protein